METCSRSRLFRVASELRSGVGNMLIGIMADTHDKLPSIDDAVARLNQRKVELVLHAGDFIAPFVVPRFKPLTAKLIGVYGNNDAEREVLKKNFSELNAQIRGRFAEVNIGKMKIAMTHGDEEELVRSLIDIETYDLVVYGHTHEVKTYRKGPTLVVNPGETCGYLTGKSTIVLFNSETLEVEILPLQQEYGEISKF